MTTRANDLKGVVFSDMDGSLLDHHTYEWTEAAEALELLKRRGIPLVLCTSKTSAEVLRWQEKLAIRGPLIPENGAAVILNGFPLLEPECDQILKGHPAKIFGADYNLIRRVLKEISSELQVAIRGFGDMSVEEIAGETEMDLSEAALAAERDFDEPFLWEHPPGEEQITRACAIAGAKGLSITRGGRFWHLMGKNDKGAALRWTIDALSRISGKEVPSLAIGDSENDVSMVSEAARGVLVGRPGRPHPGGNMPPSVLKLDQIGPKGWNIAVNQWIEQLDGKTP